GVPRPDGRRAGHIRIVARDDLGWFWLIPISAALTSVGVVLPRDAFRAFAPLDHETILARAVAETPVVAQLLANARREWPVRVARRRRQRYLSFRRFVIGFYTPEFRDLFFDEDPPERMYRALATVFAGYWRPSLVTRAWVSLFLGLVRLQKRIGLVPRREAVQ